MGGGGGGGGGGASGEGFGGRGDSSGYGIEGGGGYGGYGGAFGSDVSGYGVEAGGGYGGYAGAGAGYGGGGASAGGAGFDWGGLVRDLAAWAARAHPLGTVVNPALQASIAKARGLPDVEVERAAIMATPLGQALSAVSRTGGLLQKGAIALGAKGGPQPGSGAQVSSGGFGGLDPSQAAAAQTLAQRVFAVPAPKRAQVIAQLQRGVPVFGAEPGREYGTQ
jgi:hypothetical protein